MMKIIGTLLLGVTLAGGVLANVHASELNIEKMVNFSLSCAPWDGEAYSLSFDLPEQPDFPLAHFRASIWGSGIENLKSNKSFSMDGPEGSMDSTGSAYVSSSNKSAIFVKAKFSPMTQPDKLTEPVGFGQWLIEIPMPPPSTKVYFYTISPVIDQSYALCG